jgi:pilus assembly protein CpaF
LLAPRVDVRHIRSLVRSRLLEGHGSEELVGLPGPARRMRVREQALAVLHDERTILSSSVLTEVVNQVSDEVVGLGPIERLLRDPEVSEVMVNGADDVYVERKGRIEREEGLLFEGEEQVLHLIERIVAPLGLRVDESSPYVDARLQDGSRVNAIIPPLSLCGPVMTIRKFSLRPFSPGDLVASGSVSRPVMDLLAACVRARMNIVVSGGTGSGKTTLLNVLSSFVRPSERLITIEDAAELRLSQPHVISLESRPPNVEGRGEVTIRALVRNALRMRPDRIVVGEVRGGEALDMLQAMNTGHEGSMSTAHANSPEDALGRLETMALMSDVDLPAAHVREQIAAAIDLVVHTVRRPDGRRVVSHVAALEGHSGRNLRLVELSSGDRVDTAGLLRDARRLRARLAERGDAEVLAGVVPEPATPPELVGAGAVAGGWSGTFRRLGDVLE